MSLKSKIQALITAANAKTGETDATLTDAVQSLVDGYGGGITPSGSVTLTEENTYDVTDKAQAIVDFSATRADLAEAVTAKGVDTLPTASFDTIATNIGLIEGGGGGDIPLPPGITKQDCGSFTLAATTKTDLYAISHNLGEVPKGFYLWTDDETSASATDMYAVVYSTFLRLTHDSQSGTSVAGSIMHYYRITTGKTTNTSRTMTSAQLSGYATETQFRLNNGSINYRPGNTYKWIAWA